MAYRELHGGRGMSFKSTCVWYKTTLTKVSTQLFPREDLDACRRYGDFWQSYCDRDDSVCDRGASAQVHLGYVERYRDEIVDFIVEKVKGSQSRGFENRGKSDDL